MCEYKLVVFFLISLRSLNIYYRMVRKKVKKMLKISLKNAMKKDAMKKDAKRSVQTKKCNEKRCKEKCAN